MCGIALGVAAKDKEGIIKTVVAKNNFLKRKNVIFAGLMISSFDCEAHSISLATAYDEHPARKEQLNWNVKKIEITIAEYL